MYFLMKEMKRHLDDVDTMDEGGQWLIAISGFVDHRVHKSFRTLTWTKGH